MNPDRMQIAVPGTDPAPMRRPCGCRGDRGQHQEGCPERGKATEAARRAQVARFLAWLGWGFWG